MKCPFCDSTHVNIRMYKIMELKKGSPTRGKNKQYTEVNARHYTCMSCQSQSVEYK